MISCNVQNIYDLHICELSPAERLRLVELIMRGMAAPDVSRKSDGLEPALLDNPGWQPIDHRGDLTDWRDRVL